MFTDADNDKLHQIMAQNPENQALIQKLLDSNKEAISMISHEIRNPLTLVYSSLQLIERTHPEVITYKYWPAMKEDLEYMKHLLEELSSYNNGASLTLTKMDFYSFMQQIVLSFAVTFVDTDVEFTSFIKPGFPPFKGDATKLREVFLNLLRNASEAVSEKGTIMLRAEYVEDSITVRIADNGCGINPEDISNIFLPFTTYKQGGTGLGLAVVKRTVEAHGGTIHVTSDSGSGTVFTVVLPI